MKTCKVYNILQLHSFFTQVCTRAGLLANLREVRVLTGTQEHFCCLRCGRAHQSRGWIVESNVEIPQNKPAAKFSRTFSIFPSFYLRNSRRGNREKGRSPAFSPPFWHFHNCLSFLPTCAVSLTAGPIVLVPLAARWSSAPSINQPLPLPVVFQG